jgi:hypothetical protein
MDRVTHAIRNTPRNLLAATTLTAALAVGAPVGVVAVQHHGQNHVVIDARDSGWNGTKAPSTKPTKQLVILARDSGWNGTKLPGGKA